MSFTTELLIDVTSVLIVWRCVRNRYWTHYPLFTLFVTGLALKNLLFTHVIRHYQTDSVYRIVFWRAEAITIVLWVLVTWEIVRHAFPAPLASKRFSPLWLVGFPVAASAIVVIVNRLGIILTGTNGFYMDLERIASGAHAISVLVVLILAQRYSVPLGRNVWGMSLGFGMFLSINLINFAAYGLVADYLPTWVFTNLTNHVFLLGTWTWAMWSYAPNPLPSPPPEEPSEQQLIEWRIAWDRTMGVVRGVFRP